MRIYAKEIHDCQYYWLIVDCNLLYKLMQCQRQEITLDMSSLCSVIPETKTVYHESVMTCYEVKDLVRSLIELTWHFVQKACLYVAYAEELCYFHYPVSKNVALVIAGFQYKKTKNTDLSAKGKSQQTELYKNLLTYKILPKNMQDALLHHKIRRQIINADSGSTAPCILIMHDIILQFAFWKFLYTKNKVFEMLDDSNKSFSAEFEKKLLNSIFLIWLPSASHNEQNEKFNFPLILENLLSETLLDNDIESQDILFPE